MTETAVMEPWQQRVVQEHAELNERMVKLIDFMGHEQFRSLPPAQQALLAKQLTAMTAYRDVLTERINLF